MTRHDDERAPLVSVIIPAYRAEPFIEDAIASIRKQEHRPIEVVVVDDCSPDATANVVATLAAEWSAPGFEVRLLRQSENRGGAAALARGFAEARGDYLCWLSSDDAYVGTKKITEQVRQLRRHPGISYSQAFYSGPRVDDITPDLLITATWRPGQRWVESLMRASGRARLVGLLFLNPINGSTVMIDRSTWERHGNFDEALGNIDQDSDMWMRYSARGARIASIPGPAGFYRIHEGQTSQLRDDCSIGAAATRIRIIDAYERHGELSRLLRVNWPVLWLAHRWEWYLSRPIVAEYLVEAGLRCSRHPLVRRSLRRIGQRLTERGIPEPTLAARAREKARGLADSPEFELFERSAFG